MGFKISFSDKVEKELREELEGLSQQMKQDKRHYRFDVEMHRDRINDLGSVITDLKHKVLSLGGDPETGNVNTIDDLLDSLEEQVERDG